MITNHIGVEIGRGRALLLSFTSLYTHNLFFLFACQNFWKDLVPPPPSPNPTPHPPFLICFRRHWTISRMETKQNKAWHFDTYDVLAIWFMIFFKGKWKTVDFAFTDENGLPRKKNASQLFGISESLTIIYSTILNDFGRSEFF